MQHDAHIWDWMEYCWERDDERDLAWWEDEPEEWDDDPKWDDDIPF